MPLLEVVPAGSIAGAIRWGRVARLGILAPLACRSTWSRTARRASQEQRTQHRLRPKSSGVHRWITGWGVAGVR
ncbi:hypothetical protein [Dactylosporangium sp. NPDC006015]|uniref:hypothetical protein n=1 Tax=Dactylosporangium sp. NPDC006015 TaxID=3154576 RepID=UPI0033ADD058